ncbi:retinol dehydrogenase 12-like isoform X2 [Phalaenopsis equestris]|uniref:retinol dehydrogenase 12-like isoform X2 n=1 Tax=Phalaenopsis equestris TaxID=78828 RepID=UPI0009E59C18|nr:retinol dehydrogenase 12-like isoform X2 [Phalaenopsis equestris]
MGSAASSTSTAGDHGGVRESRKKEALDWLEWGRGWLYVVGEFFFQRISASHLENPLTLPHLDGFTCIVTGSTSGIGLEVARQLAEAGAHVVMAVRRMNIAYELIQKWQNDKEGLCLPLNVEVMELDLLSLDSVRQFAKAWNARQVAVHALINNAEPQRFSKDGFEQHMQVNHLAPALLSMLLIPSLLRGSPSRIINVNSIMHVVGFVNPEDMNITSGKRKYTSLAGYSNSKLAQIKFSSILQKRLPAEAGINVICVSPGIVHTNVARDLPKVLVAGYHLIPYFIFNAQEGSRSTLFATTDPQISDYCAMLKDDEWLVCPYISHDCRPANASEEAHNLETSQAVWEKSLEMIGLPSDALEKLIEGKNLDD